MSPIWEKGEEASAGRGGLAVGVKEERASGQLAIQQREIVMGGGIGLVQIGVVGGVGQAVGIEAKGVRLGVEISRRALPGIHDRHGLGEVAAAALDADLELHTLLQDCRNLIVESLLRFQAGGCAATFESGVRLCPRVSRP